MAEAVNKMTAAKEAVEDLEKLARKDKTDKDRLMMLAIAVKSMETASNALARIH
jgi:hypothetical protein